MAVLKIRAGANPADPADVQLWFGEEAIENAKVIEAYNDHGKKRVIAEIIWEEKLGRKEVEKSDKRKGDDLRAGSVVEQMEGTAQK